MLEKYFVPYNRALKLKELEFDESVDYYYTPNGEIRQSCGLFNYPKKLYPDYIKRPLFCQVFDWFREKYTLDKKLDIVFDEDIKKYTYQIYKEKENIYPHSRETTNYFNSFEEAQLACLDKLIEICEKSVS